MKRALCAIIVICLLGSCRTTNDFTEKDFARGKKPMKPVWGLVAGLVPGLPQFINGEILEGAILMGSVLVAGNINEAIGEFPSKPDPGKEIPFYALNGVAYAAMAYSMADGYSSSRDRVDQYELIFDQTSLFTEKEKTAIKERKIFIGMSRAALLESWGEPETINNSAGSWGSRDQYVYPNYTYVYVEEGKVSGWN